MTGVEVLFAFLGLVVVGSASLVVTVPRVVHAALWLVVTLGAVAGCFLVLTAELLAWVQVLIYVGAVVVLLLFALMLTAAPTGPVPPAPRAQRLAAAVVATGIGGLLVVSLWTGFGADRIDFQAAPVGTASAVGDALFAGWVLPFEVLSVLLLAALVGAIVLSRDPEPAAGPHAGDAE